MKIVFGVLIGIIILMLLVIAHELGHFIMARKNGVKVNEFGIGFPPRAIAWIKKNGKWTRLPKSEWQKPQDSLILSLNFLPIGGFCAMDGESDSDRRKGTFGAATFWGKTKILFGGVLMNWLVAAIILTILAFTGMPQFINNQFYLENDAQITGEGITIAEVLPDSPAAKVGMQSGDKLIAIDNRLITLPTEVTDYGTSHAGNTGKYTILRGEEEIVLEPKLNPAGSEYALGISMTSGQTFIRSTWSAPIVGVGTTLQLTGETFRSLGELVWNLVSGVVQQFSFNSEVREAGQSALQSAGDSVSGPVGIIGVIFPAFAESGLTNLAFLAALVSVSLACMNILPIPALDGGRWLLIAIYRLRRKTLTKETEERIVSRAMMVLLMLIAIISILDITRFF
jgi:regulator of sigma E protease